MNVKRYDNGLEYSDGKYVLAADYDSLLELARRLRKAYINYRYEDDNMCGDSEWLEE